MKCKNCGISLEPGSTRCEFCGELTGEENIQSVEAQVVDDYNVRSTASKSSVTFVNATPFIVWSIVNIVLCCLPLGIVGLIYAVKANSATNQYEAEELVQKSKMWNMIGTISSVVATVLYLIFIFSFAPAGMQ